MEEEKYKQNLQRQRLESRKQTNREEEAKLKNRMLETEEQDRNCKREMDLVKYQQWQVTKSTLKFKMDSLMIVGWVGLVCFISRPDMGKDYDLVAPFKSFPELPD